MLLIKYSFYGTTMKMEASISKIFLNFVFKIIDSAIGIKTKKMLSLPF